MLWALPICFLHRSSSVSPLVSQFVPSTSIYSVTYRAKWKTTYCILCVWLMKRVGQTLCNQGRGPIGLGRVHLADCKRISCRQCHAADGQFASDFQSGAKPFRSFGSPSTIRQQPLMSYRWLWRPSCLCFLRGPSLTFRQHSLWPRPLVSQKHRSLVWDAFDTIQDLPPTSTPMWIAAKKNFFPLKKCNTHIEITLTWFFLLQISWGKHPLYLFPDH